MDGNKSGGKASGRIAKGGTAQGGSDVYKIVKMIMEHQFQPVIIFSFCRRECEQHAMSMSKLDFNTEEEKEIAEEVFKKAILYLREEDIILPVIELMLPLLQRGTTVHHCGLLPVIKELVELLFQEGLVKALFATETFAMSLNMPAKTVVFTSVKKWDGDNNGYIGECPLDLKEAISSLCFAAPRCSDLPELQQVQLLFAAKYGREFFAAASELLPDCGVNRQIIELLSVRAPSVEARLKLLKEIAEEHEVEWDPAASEIEFLKPHEDLLIRLLVLA